LKSQSGSRRGSVADIEHCKVETCRNIQLHTDLHHTCICCCCVQCCDAVDWVTARMSTSKQTCPFLPECSVPE